MWRVPEGGLCRCGSHMKAAGPGKGQRFTCFPKVEAFEALLSAMQFSGSARAQSAEVIDGTLPRMLFAHASRGARRRPEVDARHGLLKSLVHRLAWFPGDSRPVARV